MTTATETPQEAITEEATEAPEPAPAPAPERDRPRRTVIGVGLTDSTLNRMRDCGFFDVGDDLESIGSAEVVAVSTRVPPGKTIRRKDFEVGNEVPVVAVCHAGGEEVAVAMMREGFSGVVAEGNEQAIYSFVDPEDFEETMVETFIENEEANGGSGGRTDPVTGLANSSAFESDLAEFLEAGATPVLFTLRLRNLDTARQRTDPLTVSGLRRRLADAYENSARRYGANTYALDRNTFAIVDARQVVMDSRGFAGSLMRVTEAYAPAGIPMILAVGSVRCGETFSLEAILQQADQAVAAASNAPASAFVDGDDAAMLLASVTELRVAAQLAAQADEMLPYAEGHSERVAELAARIAESLGLKGRDLASLKLAALLHDVGRTVDPEDGAEPPDALQSSAERAGRYALPSAGPSVAEAVSHQLERWDGEGPEGISADDIPLGARIIAVADSVDAWMRPASEEGPMSATAVVDKLGEESGSRFDPAVAKAAASLLQG